MDVAKVERTPVGVSGKGTDVATGVVASVLLDVEFTATLKADGDARTIAEDEARAPVNDGRELGGDDPTLDGEEGAADSERVTPKFAGEEYCAGVAAGLVGTEADGLSRIKLAAAGLGTSDEDDSEVQVTGTGAP